MAGTLLSSTNVIHRFAEGADQPYSRVDFHVSRFAEGKDDVEAAKLERHFACNEAAYKKVGVTRDKLLAAFSAARRRRRPDMTAAEFSGHDLGADADAKRNATPEHEAIKHAWRLDGQDRGASDEAAKVAQHFEHFSESFAKMGVTRSKLLAAFTAARRQQRRPTLTAAEFIGTDPDAEAREAKRLRDAWLVWSMTPV